MLARLVRLAARVEHGLGGNMLNTKCEHPEIIDTAVCECGSPALACEHCDFCLCDCHPEYATLPQSLRDYLEGDYTDNE